ncbi:type II secretion system inner membrane protein GspF [soil metagenome]
MAKAALAGAKHGTFFYVASRPGGGTSLGVRAARSRPALAESLRREKLLLKTAYLIPGATQSERGLNLRDQAILNEQLAQLLSRGVPLIEALEVAAQTVSPPARGRVDKMREQVSAGATFADAAGTAGGLDAVTCAIYRAAERTGDLAGSARQLALAARRTLAVAGRATTLLIYPLIVLAVAAVVAVVMLVFIVPKLGEQLVSTGQRLPWYTAALVWLGNLMSDNILIFGAVAVVVFIVVAIFRKVIATSVFDTMRKLPLFGALVLAQESARFFSVMAAMTRSGIPLADGLATANQAVGHPLLRSQMDRLRTRLVEGGVLRNLIEQVDALPLGTRRLLIAAERSGDLETAFSALAGDMTEEVDRRSQRLLAVLQPLLIVVMFMVIGSLLMAIMVPLLNMSSNLGDK